VARLRGLVASARRARTRRAAWSWVLEAGDLAQDALTLLAGLGARGRQCARTLRPFTRAPRPTVRVTGGDVVAWLGIEPGPRVGELLARLRLAAAMGEIANRPQARSWLTGQVRRAPVTGYNV